MLLTDGAVAERRRRGQLSAAALESGLRIPASIGWYGEMDLPIGKVGNTHAVTNHRIALFFMYRF